MEKEKRHLIQEKGDELIATYDKLVKEAKEKGDTVTAYAYVCAQNGVYRLMNEILMLDMKGLI